jgi:hypothetical protein
MPSSTDGSVKRLAIILVGCVGGVYIFTPTVPETEAEAVENRPSAEFEYEYDGEGTLTITHAGGDTLRQFDVRKNHSLPTNYTVNNGDSNTISRGDTITVTDVESGDTIVVVWVGAGDGSLLGEYTIS